MLNGAGRVVSFGLLALVVSCTRGGERTEVEPTSPLRPADTPASPAQGAGVNAAGFIHIPGALVYQTCVHELPSGARIGAGGQLTTSDGQPIPAVPACPYHSCFDGQDQTACGGSNTPSPSGGWVAWDATPVPSPATQFNALNSGTFEVPATPTQECNYDYSLGTCSNTLFMFPSIQSTTWIVQPVLQWGQECFANLGCIGSWAHYTYASWVASDPAIGVAYF